MDAVFPRGEVGPSWISFGTRLTIHAQQSNFVFRCPDPERQLNEIRCMLSVEFQPIHQAFRLVERFGNLGEP